MKTWTRDRTKKDLYHLRINKGTYMSKDATLETPGRLLRRTRRCVEGKLLCRCPDGVFNFTTHADRVKAIACVETGSLVRSHSYEQGATACCCCSVVVVPMQRQANACRHGSLGPILSQSSFITRCVSAGPRHAPPCCVSLERRPRHQRRQTHQRPPYC